MCIYTAVFRPKYLIFFQLYLAQYHHRQCCAIYDDRTGDRYLIDREAVELKYLRTMNNGVSSL